VRVLVALGLIGWVLVSAVSDPRLGRVAVGLAATVAIAGGVLAGRRGGPARGWWWAAGAVALWAVGDMIWWAESGAGQAPGTVATIGLVGYGGPVLVAAWVLDGAAQRPMTFIRQVLDGLIVGGSVLFGAWVLLLRLTSGHPLPDQGRWAALLTHTALAAALATTVVMIGLTYAGSAQRPWVLAAAGLALLAVTSAVALTNPATWPLAAGSVAALLLLAAATWRETGSDGRRPGAVLTPKQELIPNAAVVVILVAVVVGDIVGRPRLIAAALALMSMVAARRLLISQEKHLHATTLNQDLARRDAELIDIQSLLHRAFEESLSGGLWTAPDGTIQRANRAFCRMLGRTEDTLIGIRLSALVDPASTGRTEEMFSQARAIGGLGLPVELRYPSSDGQTLWALHTAAVFRTVEDAPIQMGVQVIDVTEARLAARRQAHQARFLDAILENMGSAVVACDAQGRVNLINLCTREMFNLPPAPWIPPPGVEQPPVFHPDGITPMPPEQRPLSRSLRGETVRDVETVFGEAGENRRIVMSNAHRLLDDDGSVLGAVLVMNDVTERRRVESALIRQALHDPLTDLANRALLGDRLDQAIARQQR
ncbi:MAG TPA: PAS domain-containing protein, partial [Nakamurella multipartita]|nr:PAS domain-containing protein [Nakamurella multipartita]